MLYINKDKPYNYITVTVNDIENIGGDYIIHLYGLFTTRNFIFNLYNDLSPFPTRFNLFKISSLQFDKIVEGDYIYTITHNDTELEKGMLRLYSSDTPPSYNVDNSDADDFFYIADTE